MAEAAESLQSRLGRAADYIFGRNAMIGIASVMLLVISGYATWHGMRDFIVGVSATGGQASGDGFSVSSDILVVAIVVALTFLMWLALREVFGVKRRLTDRLVMFPLYVFLFLWSIGFGYGFWWSLISGEEATRTGLSGLQEDARDAASAISARLEAVRSQLDNVVAWSDGQMLREETGGGSCGVPSGAGRGPLYNARRSVRDTVTSLRDGMVRSWLGPVQADVEALKSAAQGLAGGTVAERQKSFERTAADIRGRARNIAARSNELGRSTAAQMRALAESVQIQPNTPGFSCFDPTLAQRLTAAAEQADRPAEVRLREAAFSEGPAGVANAVKNLWRNMGAYASSLFGYVFTGKAGGQTEGGDPITGRDMIALLATIGVDLGLLALAILNPPKEPPSIRPSGALKRQIEEAIDTAIARAPGADMEWVRRHFVHHNKHSYFVIPNLYSCDPTDPNEAAKAMAINQLAGVLSDLELVTWPSKGRQWLLQPSELERLKREEAVASTTDLTEVRRKWAEDLKLEGAEAEEYARRRGALRNHGLFSKAERALQIAGWSERARNDVEIFRVVEADGLTPLLMVLSEAARPVHATAGPSAGTTREAAA
jgi:hypothetical protein